MVDEGCEESQQSQTSAGNEAEKADVQPAGLDVKVQQLGSLFTWRKGTVVLMGVNNLSLVVALHPLDKANVKAVTSERVTIQVQVC